MNATCRTTALLTAILSTILAATGCHMHHGSNKAAAIANTPPVRPEMPRELCKTILPEYRIEPPDVLMIEALDVVPRPPYHLKTLDVLLVQVQGTLPNAPIQGVYPIEPGGIVNLGVPYGAVKIANLTVEGAETVIADHLKKFLREPEVSVALAELGAAQQITGNYLVGPDGTVTLGSYGNVTVIGMTITEARTAIEAHLSQFLESPEISVNVAAYNSKVYYIVVQGAGLGDGIYRFPATGNETVLDAIAQINGLEQVSSKKIWIARPTRDPNNPLILPINWAGITEMASTSTNYQVMPGDRVFIEEDKLVAFDTHLAKLITPLERIMGFTLLGTGTVTRLSGPVLRGGGNPNSNF